MAWLQSSFTNHQLIGESAGNNLRKGYNVGSLKKNTDPDKSNTPLLHDGPVSSSKNESGTTDWFNEASVAEPKKSNILQNITSKKSFLSSSFFERTGSNIVKTTPLPDSEDPPKASSSNKPKEDKNLMSQKSHQEQNLMSFKTNEKFDDEDEDSDDDWFSPHASRGYQRVKTG